MVDQMRQTSATSGANEESRLFALVVLMGAGLIKSRVWPCFSAHNII